jgi:hypothetical protein
MTIHLGRVSPRVSRDLPGWLIRKLDLSRKARATPI